MKIIIMGSGKVGHKLVEQLAQEGHDIVVIDSNPAALQALVDTEDVMCVEGNAVDYQVQLEAGISEADLVIACSDGDELNMLCCLLARKHGAARTIARVRKPEYYDQLPFIREEMGLSFAINPERASANVISRVLIFPAATSIEPFAKGRVELMEFALDAGNALIGKSLVEINKRFSFRVLICAVQRGQEVFIPGGSDVLEAGDRIYLVSSHDELQSFFKEIDLFRSSVKNVMIVGGGKISYYLAKRLLFQGMHVKIIEQNMEGDPGGRRVCGDDRNGRDQCDSFPVRKDAQCFQDYNKGDAAVLHRNVGKDRNTDHHFSQGGYGESDRPVCARRIRVGGGQQRGIFEPPDRRTAGSVGIFGGKESTVYRHSAEGSLDSAGLSRGLYCKGQRADYSWRQ